LTAHEKTHSIRDGGNASAAGVGPDGQPLDVGGNPEDEKQAPQASSQEGGGSPMADGAALDQLEKGESPGPSKPAINTESAVPLPSTTPQIIFSTLRQEPRSTQPQAIFNINKDQQATNDHTHLHPHPVQFLVEHQAHQAHPGQAVNTLGISSKQAISNTSTQFHLAKAQIFEVIQGEPNQAQAAHVDPADNHNQDLFKVEKN